MSLTGTHPTNGAINRGASATPKTVSDDSPPSGGSSLERLLAHVAALTATAEAGLAAQRKVERERQAFLASLPGRIQETERRLEQAKGELQATRQQLDQAKQLRERAVAARVNPTTGPLAELGQEIGRLEAELPALRAAVNATIAELEELRSQLPTKRTAGVTHPAARTEGKPKPRKQPRPKIGTHAESPKGPRTGGGRSPKSARHAANKSRRAEENRQAYKGPSPGADQYGSGGKKASAKRRAGKG